ncbi:MAG: hypothetical protein COA71_04090 [SAR86 cluster bacterium]|uniref:Uncharacterized protein n=1 Tax=SAR86 cluster bacterium TaxID=2030880 RepID=A0A2A5CG17_9GAMM|nr:MAG: hypothetical protein COA71_04090 [SAR86 cluster bacterium]
MKDSDDKILQDYLKGNDEVSATYQSLQDEKSSVALDEFILRAARDAVTDKPIKQKRIPAQAYSVAASICVAVLAGALFLNNESELTRNEIEAFTIPVLDMPVSEMLSADDAVAALQSDTDANINTGAVAEALDLNANRIALPAPQFQIEVAESLEETATGAAFSTNDNMVEAETAMRRVEEVIVTAEVRETEELEARSSEELLELVETADLSQAIQFPGYRQNTNTWLAEIQRLTQAGNAMELAEERRLFAQNYPNIDIDSALIEL